MKINFSAIHDLQAWRVQVLDGILRSILVIWLFALLVGVNNVIKDYRNEAHLYTNPVLIAASVIAIYFILTGLLVFITFARWLRYELRAMFLLLIFYILGTVGFSLSSFSGDGRILLFAFVILAAILLDLRYSLFALAASFATFVVVGYLQVFGYIVIPPARQINSTDPGAWLSGGMIFITMSIATYVSINYLLRALQDSLDKSRKSLSREQHLSRILRTVSDINQLVVREQDTDRLLAEACERLVSGRGYAFAWVGLLNAEGNTIRLAAYAGDSIDADRFTVHLDREDSGLSCVRVAIQTRTHCLIDPSSNTDLCQACPSRQKFPDRSAIALPLMREERIFGALVVDHVSPSLLFDDSEINLLKELADNLVYALEKLETDRQLQSVIRRETLVNQIARAALETPDLESMLQTLADRLCETIRATACYIVLCDTQSQPLAPAAAAGPFREAFLSIKLEAGEHGLALLVLQEGQPLILDDVRADARVSLRIAEAFSIRSLLGLPITADGRRLGAVFLTFDEPHHFTSDEVAFEQQAVGHAALALTKAILYQDARAKASELGRLYAAAEDMASSLLDTDALLHILLRHMTEALDATSGYISAVNLSSGSQLILAEYWSASAGQTERTPNLGDVYSLDDYLAFRRALNEGRVVVLQSDDADMTAAEHRQFIDYGVSTIMFVPVMSHGEIQGGIEIWESRAKRNFTLNETNLVLGMASHAASIIRNAQLFDSLRVSEERFRTLIEQAADGIFIADPQRRYVDVNLAACRMLGYTREELLSMQMDDLAPLTFPEAARQMAELREGKILIVERQLKCKDGSLLPVEISAKLLPNGNLQGIARDITERKQAEGALRTSEEKFRSLAENIPSVVYQCRNDERYTFLYLNDAIEELTGYPADVFLKQNFSFFALYHPDDLPLFQAEVKELDPAGTGPFHVTYRILHRSGEWRWVDEWGTCVSDSQGQVQYLEGVMIDITERKRTEHDLRRRADELEILAQASSALRSAPNVTDMFAIVTQQAVQVVHGAYGSLFLQNLESNELISQGWYSAGETDCFSQPDLRCPVGLGITGQVVLSGEVYLTIDLKTDPLGLLFEAQNACLSKVCSGISLPLRAQTGLIGVLHVWMEAQHTFDESDIRLLTALADMAGSAIQRGVLHEQALSHADELSQAYDKTLAGWARALELRDEQTEGHTRRVTELALRLAPNFGVSESELVHLGRGALLHDIGKMGIPDAILHKPGPLTAQEKSIMERHPQYAYDMLAMIPFLRPALDIPYCHHEHWDGTGYPRGLRGEDIPLAARIFAVVDVWDALTSDRPYRKAWSKARTIGYLQENAGKYFDPRIVETFLNNIIGPIETRQT